MNKELKPCPFCGSKNLYLFSKSHTWIQCNNCLAEIGICDSEEEAIERWNRRTNNEVN